MLALLLVYGKIAAYVASGFAAARVYFHKEILAGKALLAHMEAVVKADAQKVESAVKTEVGKVEADVKAVEKKL